MTDAETGAPRLTTNVRWLRCEVSDGMFPNELSVSVPSADPPVSMFVSNVPELVRRTGHTGGVRVDLLGMEGLTGVVLLPTSPIEGSRVVRVPLSALRKGARKDGDT